MEATIEIKRDIKYERLLVDSGIKKCVHRYKFSNVCKEKVEMGDTKDFCLVCLGEI